MVGQALGQRHLSGAMNADGIAENPKRGDAMPVLLHLPSGVRWEMAVWRLFPVGFQNQTVHHGRGLAMLGPAQL